MNPRANRVPPSSTIGNGGLPTNPFTGYYNNVMQSPKTSMFTNMKDAIVPVPKTPPVFASPNTTASPITQFNQIDEIFKCFICFEKAVEPHLCPFCSKIVCYACIKKWLEDQRRNICPHCRYRVTLKQMVNCRFVSEITSVCNSFKPNIQELERLSSQQSARRDQKKKQTVENCAEHNLPLGYYCETCCEALCSDCAMFESKHQQHKFKKIGEVYDKHIETIKQETTLLEKRLDELNFLVSSVDENISRVQKAKEERSIELKKAYNEMQEKLASELEKKLDTLSNQKTAISEQVHFAEKLISTTQLEIENNSQSTMIGRTNELTKLLQEFNSKPIDQFAKQHVSSDFANELVPTYDWGVFRVHGFTSLQDTQEVIYSSPLVVNGLTWRLKAYPNGTGVARGVFVSVFIEMFKGLKEPTKYEYRVEMINHKNRNASVIREYSSTFEVGECWGYNKFYKIDLLEKEGFILPEHDAIVFRFYIRAPNNYEKCKEQQKYIKSLEESRRVLQLQVEEYKRQLHERSGNSENVTPRYNVQLQNEGPSATDLPEEQQEEPVPPVEQTEHETEEPPTVTNDSAIDDRQLTPLMIAREKKRQSISRNISKEQLEKVNQIRKVIEEWTMDPDAKEEEPSLENVQDDKCETIEQCSPIIKSDDLNSSSGDLTLERMGKSDWSNPFPEEKPPQDVDLEDIEPIVEETDDIEGVEDFADLKNVEEPEAVVEPEVSLDEDNN